MGAGKTATSRGFSLLEVLVVLAITIVISSMSVPMLIGTARRYRLQSSAATVSGVIQSTRLRAVSTGLPFRLTLNRSASTYQIAYCSVCSQGSAITYDTAENAILFSAAPDLKLSADQTVYFHPNGAVQKVDGTTDCSEPVATFSLYYADLSKTITAGCYGKVTVSQ
ncbi:MAG: hypothetical protein CXZ00_15540 [Acidobacteria bacterium]|nr:MAG: hypothetical protein CXZ00_15540 [Acidobacteriota bacterium]